MCPSSWAGRMSGVVWGSHLGPQPWEETVLRVPWGGQKEEGTWDSSTFPLWNPAIHTARSKPTVCSQIYLIALTLKQIWVNVTNFSIFQIPQIWGGFKICSMLS